MVYPNAHPPPTKCLERTGKTCLSIDATTLPGDDDNCDREASCRSMEMSPRKRHQRRRFPMEGSNQAPSLTGK